MGTPFGDMKSSRMECSGPCRLKLTSHTAAGSQRAFSHRRTRCRFSFPSPVAQFERQGVAPVGAWLALTSYGSNTRSGYVGPNERQQQLLGIMRVQLTGIS